MGGSLKLDRKKEKKKWRTTKKKEKVFLPTRVAKCAFKKSLHPNIHEITVFLRGTYF